MQKIIVTVSSELIEKIFTTGYEIGRTIVSRGIPDGCMLRGISINQLGNIEFAFVDTNSEGEDKKVNVEVTRLLDASE